MCCLFTAGTRTWTREAASVICGGDWRGLLGPRVTTSSPPSTTSVTKAMARREPAEVPRATQALPGRPRGRWRPLTVRCIFFQARVGKNCQKTRTKSELLFCPDLPPRPACSSRRARTCGFALWRVRSCSCTLNVLESPAFTWLTTQSTRSLTSFRTWHTFVLHRVQVMDVFFDRVLVIPLPSSPIWETLSNRKDQRENDEEESSPHNVLKQKTTQQWR